MWPVTRQYKINSKWRWSGMKVSVNLVIINDIVIMCKWYINLDQNIFVLLEKFCVQFLMILYLFSENGSEVQQRLIWFIEAPFLFFKNVLICTYRKVDSSSGGTGNDIKWSLYSFHSLWTFAWYCHAYFGLK